MARIEIRDLHVHFGDVVAVDGINLEVEDGEFVIFLGPSGCGKTTTLRCIAGLEVPTSGEIRFDGRSVNDLDAIHRNVAMVFQFISLYPHLTVRQNIAFPLKARRLPKATIAEKIDWVSRIFDLSDILDRHPGRLPPGARQKAALARSVVRDPNVLLLDEPLSAIDEQFREEMRWELRHLQKELGVTSIYVTHDQREAMSLADRIVLMNEGSIVQAGAPTELFDDPINRFSGYFIGSPAMNFIKARRDGDRVMLAGGAARTALPDHLMRLLENGEVILGIRPQHVRTSDRETEYGCIRATPSRVSSIGREHWFDIELGGTTIKGMSESRIEQGTTELVAMLDVQRLHVFNLQGDRLRGESSE